MLNKPDFASGKLAARTRLEWRRWNETAVGEANFRNEQNLRFAWGTHTIFDYIIVTKKFDVSWLYRHKNWKMSHFKSRLFTVKRFLSLLKDFLFKIGMRINPLTVQGFKFQMLSFYWQSFSFGLKMKSFVVQGKYNF